MAKLSSKRTRKDRDKFALKHKGGRGQPAIDVGDLLSDELRNECAHFRAVPELRILQIPVILPCQSR